MNPLSFDWKNTERQPRDLAEYQVYELLESLGIGFEAYRHEPSPTAAHVTELDQRIRGRHCKNLFLKNSLGDQLFLLIVPYDTTVNLRQVARLLGSTRLSFAPATLMADLLGLEPGSVSPFGLINDREHVIRVLLDAVLADYEHINFHPNVGTATVSLAFEDFEHFLDWTGNRWGMISLTPNEEEAVTC